ncbi:MAG: MipA/OmpV family protein [Candidatus Omnitrophica bacterium]|nr:MipA/OmpV family protein [Candidatus Omnitrophota bacterium]
MNKKFLVASFCCVLWSGAALAAEDLHLLGVGVLTSTSPYHGVGTRVMTLPLVVWDHKGFYIKGEEFGYRLYKEKPLKVSVMVSPRLMGYHSSDSDALQGMEDREMSLDAGVRAEWAGPWPGGVLSAKVVSDVLSRSRGQEAELRLAEELKGEIWHFTPAVGVRVQSSRLTDYYYGVRAEEVRADRPEYRPGAAVNYFAEAMLSCGVARNWIMVIKGGAMSPDSCIRRSPIVERDVFLTGLAAVVRRF